MKQKHATLEHLHHSFNNLIRQRLRDIIEQLRSLSDDLLLLGENCGKRVDTFTDSMQEFLQDETCHYRKSAEHIVCTTEDLLAHISRDPKETKMSKDTKYIDKTLLESLLADINSNLNKLVCYINDDSIGAVRQILAKDLARKTHSTIDGSTFQISLTIKETEND